jgi:hypothetical protein
MRTFPRPRLALAASLVLTAAACGASSSDEGPADAARADAPALPRVQKVNCPTSVAVEITEVAKSGGAGYDYSPNPAVLPVGTIARFRSGAIHATRSLEPGLFEVESGQTECFRFNTKETHPIYCTAHGFTGSVVVK